jgi:vancomycin resistance protein YoaR
VDIPIQTKINDDWLNYHADQIAQLVDVPRVQSILEVVDLPNGTATVSATMGTPGLVLDRTDFRNQIRAAMFGMEPGPIKSRLREEPVGVTERDLAKAQGRAIKLLTKKLFLSTDEGLEEKIWELSGRDLVGFVSIAGGFDEKLLAEYLTGVAETVNRPPQNALFQFDQTQQKVVEFAPAKDGLTLDRNGTTALMAAALTMLEDKAETEPVRVVMRRTEPEISLATVNDLGIIEHLGRGESTYFGSIASRVHNVRLASERINGTLIEPGEEFSFNEVVGEISGATGYKQAYVIIGGKTELGDGGGVCQVSTTIFRAALLAGLPITDRRAHAYRVGYYEQDVKAGIDATVYAPYTDFKFLNDTPAYLLIQTMVDEPNRHLIFDIYGTSDGRTSEISNHTVCCITPPPPDVFVDDPTLPVGQEKQIEYAVAGAKARFDYRVTRGGEIIFEKTFHSNYKAWASVYLRGTMGL